MKYKRLWFPKQFFILFFSSFHFARVLLLLLLVPIVSARHNEESDEAEDYADDIKILEDLEDLILRQGNVEAYIHHEGGRIVYCIYLFMLL